MIKFPVAALAALAASAGCAHYQTIETGHKGLMFDPNAQGGTGRDILPEGRYFLGRGCGNHCKRVIDFDVTYTTSHESIKITSKENLTFDVKLAIIYKPIVSQLYELATEVSTNDYYREVVQPEFRSAASRVFAHHSWTELAADKEAIENEIEKDVQRRIKNKHVEVTSVTIEFELPGEIRSANQARIVAEQESIRQRAAMEQEATRQKAQLEAEDLKAKLTAQRESERLQQQIKNKEAEQKLQIERQVAMQHLELERQVEQKKIDMEVAKAEAERQLEEKKLERKVAEEDAKLQHAKAAGTITKARADAEARIILARALAEENRAKAQAISPQLVQMKAYEALGQLAGNGTTVMLGDFSKIPAFLFPPMFQQAMYPGFGHGGGAGSHGTSAP
jgi:regulator of protease activity HflC (stomatin/prohibitin superfamily)